MRTLQRDFEIVVSHYKENLNWTKPYQKHTTIYNKDPDTSHSEYINLPNVGRESHTYLYHIIQNYDDLATMTLFTQGRIDDIDVKKPLWYYGIPSTFSQNGLKSFYNWYNGSETINWERYKFGVYSRNMRMSPYTFGQWWDRFIQQPRPNPINYMIQYKAVFSVHRNVIQMHKKEYYENLISCVNDHINPEEGHYFERAWYHVFCPNPNNKVLNKNINIKLKPKVSNIIY
jgi:hypothetical protein